MYLLQYWFVGCKVIIQPGTWNPQADGVAYCVVYGWRGAVLWSPLWCMVNCTGVVLLVNVL
jgi:hypothetical protein